MEKIKITSRKTAELLKDISTKKGLKEILDYDGFSLLYFNRVQLGSTVVECVRNNKTCSGVTVKLDFPEIFLKISKYHVMGTCKSIARCILGKIITKRIKSKQPENSSTPKILAVSYARFWKYYPTSPQKENKEADRDTTLGTVIMALKNKNINMVAIDVDSSFFVDFKTMIEKRILSKGLWRPVEFYLTLYTIRKVFKITKKYKEEWDKLKINDNFLNLLIDDYDSPYLSELLKDYLEKFFGYITFSAVLYTELVKRAIEVEKPDLILLSGVETAFGSAAVIAGKVKGVQTLDIQHGVIHPYHWGYIYAKDEVIDEDNKTFYCPIPDKTAVYGHYHKELLTKMSIYPEDSVVVTGSPRYDILYQAEKNYSKERFLNRYIINPTNKIILWATSFQGQNYEENIKDFKAVFETMQAIKNTTLVIKPHPLDEKRYIKIIKDNLRDYEISAVVSPGSSDTYEQLFICDLMITRGSTTAMEAVALNKPVIVLNLGRKVGIGVDYVGDGIALGVYKAEDLKPTSEKLLRDDSELAKNRERYIEKYLYKIDGKATDRVVNLVEEMIKESKRKRNGRSI